VTAIIVRHSGLQNLEHLAIHLFVAIIGTCSVHVQDIVFSYVNSDAGEDILLHS
jgi:hypothetical protein